MTYHTKQVATYDPTVQARELRFLEACGWDMSCGFDPDDVSICAKKFPAMYRSIVLGHLTRYQIARIRFMELCGADLSKGFTSRDIERYRFLRPNLYRDVFKEVTC